MLLASVSLADEPNWADKLSAWSTLGATLFAVTAIWVTIDLALRDRRKAEQQRQDDESAANLLRQQDLARAAEQRREDLARAAQERAEADQRLLEERAAADERLRVERADWDRRQVRDWQAASALALLENIAELQRCVGNLGSLRQSAPWIDAVTQLQQGAYSQAPALGNANATALYRNLVSLAVSVQPTLKDLYVTSPGSGSTSRPVETMRLNVRRYARYVRLWLCQLVETGSIPDSAVGTMPGHPDMPFLGGELTRTWIPVNTPPGWTEDTNTDPDDPQFQRRP